MIDPKTRILSVLPLLVLGSCLNLGGEAKELRYFTTERLSEEALVEKVPSASSPIVRLRRVEAAGFIKERMVRRNTSLEYGFYEQYRWTEAPVGYLERNLRRKLFQSGLARRSEASGVPSVEVYMWAFEEVGGSEVHVALTITVTGREARSLMDHDVEVRVPMSGSGPEAMAAALSEALDQASREAARSIITAVAP